MASRGEWAGGEQIGKGGQDRRYETSNAESQPGESAKAESGQPELTVIMPDRDEQPKQCEGESATTPENDGEYLD